MASAALIPQFADGLMTRLDEMMTSLLISGAGVVTSEHISNIAVEAEEHGLVLAACAAKSLLETLRVSMCQSAIPRQVSTEDLAQLQATLDGEVIALRSSKEDLRGDNTLVNAVPTSFADDSQFISDFISEAREHLSLIESKMLELERNPHNTEVLNSVFRTFHTIKGLAGFFEFDLIQTISHQVETLLDLAR